MASSPYVGPASESSGVKSMESRGILTFYDFKLNLAVFVPSKSHFTQTDYIIINSH